MSAIHVAVTRQVKPGCEAAFAASLREFARRSLHLPGVTGVQLIEPVPGTNGCEFGILRSFENEESSELFYNSDLFRAWNEEVADLVIGDAVRRRLHGLEAFFRDAGSKPPPRWKMAVVTWLGVFPCVLVWSNILPKYLTRLPPLLIVAIVNVFVVISLAWLVMPLLTRLFAGWLHSTRPQ